MKEYRNGDPCFGHGSFSLDADRTVRGERNVSGSAGEGGKGEETRRIMVLSDLFPEELKRLTDWWQGRLKTFLASCSDYLADFIGGENITGIFVCGSYAGGELSVVFETGSPILLSDIDLVVVLNSLEAFRRYYPRRSELGEACEELMQEVRFVGRVEVGMLLPENLGALPPRPGVFDMKNRGIILHGGEELLDPVPDFERSDIGIDEALILIENRIVSFLGHYGSPRAETEEGLYCFLYEIARVYTDIATAAACLTGEYLPGYRDRLEFLNRRGIEDMLGRFLQSGLLYKIERWTVFKLTPSIRTLNVEIDDTVLDRTGRECASDLMRFWQRVKAFQLYGDPGHDIHASQAGSRRKKTGIVHSLQAWKTLLGLMPLQDRLSLAALLGTKLFTTDPLAVVREYGVRLLEHETGGSRRTTVQGARGGFPYRGGRWEDCVKSIHAFWNMLIFGRKES